MGGAHAVVSRVTSEDDLSLVLVVRTVYNLPLAVVQGEGAETGARNDCGRGKKKKHIQLNEILKMWWVEDIVCYALFKCTNFSFSPYPLYTHCSAGTRAP